MELKKQNKNLEQEIETDQFERLFGMIIKHRYMKFNREENRHETIPKESKKR